MAANNLAVVSNDAHAVMDAVISAGDLGQLSQAERNSYYAHVCQSVGLNPLTRPLEYLKLQGKLVLYARRDAADQLRKIHGISLRIREQGASDGVYTVLVEAQDKSGRVDTDMGIVPFGNLQGEARANAILKAVTKAKRRVTLSICGLGLLDETEVATIPDAVRWEEHDADGVVHEPPPKPSPADFWSRSSYLIPINGGGTPKWVERFLRAIEQAPGLAALGKLEQDNQDPIAQVMLQDHQAHTRIHEALEARHAAANEPGGDDE